MIEYKYGDAFKCDELVLIHGCNCQNTFGKGFAALVKKFYPGAWQADQDTIKGSQDKMGRYSSWSGRHAHFAHGNIVVVNAYTQFDPGPCFNPQAFAKVMKRIDIDFQPFELAFAMPMIGCGLGGGDWGEVSGLLENIFPTRPIRVYRFS